MFNLKNGYYVRCGIKWLIRLILMWYHSLLSANRNRPTDPSSPLTVFSLYAND